MEKFTVLTMYLEGEAQTRTIECETEDDAWCTAEDVLAEVHRDHIPGFEYVGFTKDELLTTKYEHSQVIATIVPVRVPYLVVLMRG